ncbi:MAG: peptidoglycan-binding domain-containing protein, partial [Candidatus Pacebacteria bacterium]|nr:peptidoglycan-binding domain-containing protein [Candidatus Paceibacterota bacterium]
SVSLATLSSLLAPGPATTAYLESRGLISSSSNVVVSTQAVSATATSFTRYLSVGDTGSDVRSLQTYLNNAGYAIASTGPGSRGHETAKFGSLTKAALMRFQKAHGLPSTGYFGPKTMAVVEG